MYQVFFFFSCGTNWTQVCSHGQTTSLFPSASICYSPNTCIFDGFHDISHQKHTTQNKTSTGTTFKTTIFTTFQKSLCYKTRPKPVPSAPETIRPTQTRGRAVLILLLYFGGFLAFHTDIKTNTNPIRPNFTRALS